MTCNGCGRTVLTRSRYSASPPGLCAACLRKKMEAEKKKHLAEIQAAKKAKPPSPSTLTVQPGIAQSARLVENPLVPPGQVLMSSADGSTTVITGADFLSKFVAATMSPEELKAGLGLVAGMDHEVAKAVIDKTAKIRTEQIDNVRDRIKTLLRPVVDDDMGDQELEGLSNALMAAMAVLGGGDVMAIYGVSS